MLPEGATAYETFGRRDAVVNNAGIHRYKHLAEVKEEDREVQLADLWFSRNAPLPTRCFDSSFAEISIFARLRPVWECDVKRAPSGAERRQRGCVPACICDHFHVGRLGVGCSHHVDRHCVAG
jgi:hypothetical protein